MINILLYTIAYILGLLCIPIGMIYALFKKGVGDYFFKLALAIDQLGNVAMSKLFNDTLIFKEGYKFGFEDETISSVLGKNQKANLLKPLGKFLVFLLDKIDKNHSIDAIE